MVNAKTYREVVARLVEVSYGRYLDGYASYTPEGLSIVAFAYGKTLAEVERDVDNGLASKLDDRAGRYSF